MNKKLGLTILAIGILFSGCIKDPFEGNDSGTFKDTRDNQEYGWIRIGEQIWMAENLSWLPAVSSPAVLSETAANYYVYQYEGSSVSDAKASAHYGSYGALYNWQAARSACPSGWHLPTDAEWTVLTDYLGGIAVAGVKMKSAAGWMNNGSGDNGSGFNGLPAGALDHKYGFGAVNYLGVFSTATENTSSTAWCRGLSYLEDQVNRNTTNKADGYSVRCVRD
jgi:uncharacterized protein (TIGR02145 family)